MILSLEGYINLLMKCCGARDLLWGSAVFMLYVCVLSYAQPFVTARETGMSGHFVGRIKGDKYRFKLQFLKWDFS